MLYEFGSARVVGFWSSDGYDFIASKAEENSEFVGLVLDQDNQKQLSDDRLET
jgi:flavodoxin I